MDNLQLTQDRTRGQIPSGK